MSYEIYYDRAYIRVGDKFIPLINSGSNNAFDYGHNNRMIAEKNWSVLNWKRRSQLLFSEAEIKEIAADYERSNQANGMSFKSRNQCFAHGEFERWIINGTKRAYTVEEYVSFGNGLYVLDYSADSSHDWKRYHIRSTDELIEILSKLSSAKSIDIKFSDNRVVYRPASVRQPCKTLRACDLSEYYVLKGQLKGRTVYFAKFTKRGLRFAPDRPNSYVKVFPKKKDALNYLTKHHNRLNLHTAFEPVLIKPAA